VGIAGAIDDTHATSPELLEDFVTAEGLGVRIVTSSEKELRQHTPREHIAAPLSLASMQAAVYPVLSLAPDTKVR
jgi:hypothetical protein